MLQEFAEPANLKYWYRTGTWASFEEWGGKLGMAADPTPSIAELIRRDLGALTPNERRAAHRLLADYPVAGLDTVARFGKAAGVSPIPIRTAS